MSRKLVIQIICFFSLLGAQLSWAQQAGIPLNRLWQLECERVALQNDSIPIHLAEKPGRMFDLIGNDEFAWVNNSREYSRVGAKIFRDHAVDIRNDNHRIIIDPLFDVSVSRDVADTGGFKSGNLMFNQRGIQLMGDIGTTLRFQTAFFETQTLAPDYIERMHNATGVYPSFGRTKAFGERGYDFAMATSLITYSPKNWIALQIGQGKQFYGHGYRSLLWSDATFVYPFAKASFDFWKGKIRYSTMYAELRTLQRLPKGEVPESLFKPKSASVNYLSFIPHPSIEIGIFESTIWNRFDSSGTHPPAMWAALPVLGVHSGAIGLDAENNSMVGFNFCYKPGKKLKLYAQVALDDFATKRFGWQGGMQVFDAILKGLDVQFEHNHSGDFLYASKFELQSVSHANQPLGHPAGGAFNEQILILNFRKQRWMFETKAQRLSQSGGPQSDLQADPSIQLQPLVAWGTTNLYQVSSTVSWIIQPTTCTAICAGVLWRKETDLSILLPLFTGETRYIWFGLKSNILNHYTDF
jgi:hypothetical protein